MRSSLLLGGLLSSVVIVTAFAQSNPPAPAATPAPPAATTTTTTTTASTSSMWRASKVIGVNVYNDQDEKLGSISEILLDKSGKIDGVIVGVGGFLGVGTKDVAIGIDQLDFAMSGNTEANAGDTAETAVPSGSTTMTPATPPAGTDTADAASDEGWGWNGASIDHITVNYTREQLEAAPEFEAAE